MSLRKALSLFVAVLAFTSAAAAAQAPVGSTLLDPPQPTDGSGKIEVIEFFWYECPHCNAFEPALEAWSQKLPADVALRRVPIWFQEVPFAAQQRLFYTLDALGLVPRLHRRVFATIHVDRARLRTPEDMAAFALKNGVDPMKFMSTYGSPEVAALALQARQLADAYKIDGVPAMGVQGRYYTSGSLASVGLPSKGPAVGNERMLGVVDALVARVRKPG